MRERKVYGTDFIQTILTFFKKIFSMTKSKLAALSSRTFAKVRLAALSNQIQPHFRKIRYVCLFLDMLTLFRAFQMSFRVKFSILAFQYKRNELPKNFSHSRKIRQRSYTDRTENSNSAF